MQILHISFLALTLTSCYPLTKLPAYYGSSKLSGVFVDANTGKPIEGVTVQVAWRALRHYFPEGAEAMDIHAATTVTDTNGVFTIPAWSRWVAIEWKYAGYTIVSYSKAGYKKGYADGLSNGERFSIQVSDGKGDWPEWMQKDRSLMYNPYLSPSDPELGKKITGTWTRDAEWNNSLVKITNTFKSYGGPSGSFVFTGTILSTNGTQEGTWRSDGTWNIRHAFLVNNATCKTAPPDFVGELILVLMEEKLPKLTMMS